MNWRHSTVAAASLCFCTISASATTIIDTIPQWDGARSQSWDKIAQSFTVPASDPFLARFRLGVGWATGGNYTVRLFDWDEVGNHAVGTALYDSGLRAAPSRIRFIAFDIKLPLTANETYAVIVEWDNGGFDSGVAFSFADQYSGGYNDYTNESIHDPWWFGPDTDYEMAFRATFGVPAPGGFAILTLGGAGWWRWRWRRAATASYTRECDSSPSWAPGR